MFEYTLSDLRATVNLLWPEEHAESWDHVGLVTGQDTAPVRRVLLAVDAVAATVSEALSWSADVLLTHHPLLLRGVHTIAEDTAKGALLAELIRGNCAMLAAHTNADAPAGGVSDTWAHLLKLQQLQPIAPSAVPSAGIGRIGRLPEPLTLQQFAEEVARILPSTVGGVRIAGDPRREISTVALCGGAGDSLLDHELVRAADVYVTSDLRHHPAQESLEQSIVGGGPALIDVSHWASESLWLQQAVTDLTQHLPGIEFKVSTLCTDPWTFRVG